MGPAKRRRVFHRIRFYVVMIALAAFMVAMIPIGQGAAAAEPTPAYTPATFDLFSMFPEQVLSPKTGKTNTWMPLQTANIADTSGWMWLSAQSESSFFNAIIFPPLVCPAGAQGKANSWVFVSCTPDTPEGTVGHIRVTGTRGSEQHEIWLKVTVRSSQPLVATSTWIFLQGHGYHDPALQAYTGGPVSWRLEASNYGGGQDTFALAYEADFPCEVKFRDTWGNEINTATVAGLTHNLLSTSPLYFTAEVTPTAPLVKNQPMDVTIKVGPGANTTDVSELDLQLVNPGMLFCMNDLSGMRPHAHQVMADETTTFLFHVTNTADAPADVALSLSGDDGDWEVGLDVDAVTGLAPGETAQATLTATAPAGAAVGDRLDLAISAQSSLGPAEEVSVAAEVTDVPNVYYFSIDSMDPEYLYLNRAGTGPGSEGDWLTPNIHAFMEDGVNYTNADVYLPSATDMNHTNALAGSYTGTQGVYMVGGYVRGFTEYDEYLLEVNSMDIMLYGAGGEPIKRIYEVAEEETAGRALSGFWSNKNWLADLEGERTVDVVGTSERIPLFFPAPYKYDVAGDPRTDENPEDPLSGAFSMCFYSSTVREILIPTLLFQFNPLVAMSIYLNPYSKGIGMSPGSHCEDRYLISSFLRTIEEEDPDICYMNAADLDNTGHFTGSSWSQDEWDTKGTAGAWDDESAFSPWMRRDECLDIMREIDVLFADFIQTLRDRGVYDNSIVVFLSDHGMENVKDMRNGYEVLDLRRILRAQGLLHMEDYYEAGGTEMNFIWCNDAAKLQAIESFIEGYTVDDPDLGPVQPLIAVNRAEMASGVDYGSLGQVRPMELYSEYWIGNPPVAPDYEGQLWPDLFIFPRYNYNVAAHGHALAGAANPVGVVLGNIPDNVQLGFPASHGGLQTTNIPLVFKAPAGWEEYAPGGEYAGQVEVGDITPTIYHILGWEPPACVDGEPLPY